MIRRALVHLLMITLVLATALTAGAVECEVADKPPAEGSTLPRFSLPAPQSADALNYLGVQQGQTFNVPQVKGEIVLIEIFSMYCPYCQREAPRINELYQLIAKRPETKDKLKIIGIGVGNSPYEVNLFKTKYDVPFPLFPDEDFALHKAFGQVRTPYFVAVKIKPDGSHQVIYSQLGSIHDAEKFLDLLLKRASAT